MRILFCIWMNLNLGIDKNAQFMMNDKWYFVNLINIISSIRIHKRAIKKCSFCILNYVSWEKHNKIKRFDSSTLKDIEQIWSLYCILFSFSLLSHLLSCVNLHRNVKKRHTIPLSWSFSVELYETVFFPFTKRFSLPFECHSLWSWIYWIIEYIKLISIQIFEMLTSNNKEKNIKYSILFSA